MSRPSFDLWFMRIAYVTAERGSCTRKKVGAVVVRDKDKRIISGGYNGAPRGMPDCLEVGCDVRKIDGRDSCVRTLHAESNALDLCGTAWELGDLTLYTTVIPCRNCAMRIIQHGIGRVVYHEFYLSQGTQEVQAILAGHDPATIELDGERGAVRYRPRVKLIHLDVPTEQVVPSARADKFEALLRKIWSARAAFAYDPGGPQNPVEGFETIEGWIEAALK